MLFKPRAKATDAAIESGLRSLKEDHLVYKLPIIERLCP